MRLLKRTYALPPDTIEYFEHTVEPGKRSAIIARLIQDWLDEQRRRELRAAITEGCREMADVYLETEREFHHLEEEVERGQDG